METEKLSHKLMTVSAFARLVGLDRSVVAAAIKGGSDLPKPADGTWTSPKGRVYVQVAQ